MEQIIQILCKELNLNAKHVENVIRLIDEGNTIPFIARYRKELTGSMDDQILRELSERLNYLRNLEKRREEIRSSITDQGVMNEEIEALLASAATLSELEDVYRPFRPKRRTRATIAREHGLEPLSGEILKQDRSKAQLLALASDYINENVLDAEAALSGACDIIAEQLSDDANSRKSLRALAMREAVLVSQASTEEDSVYRMYYDFSEPIQKLAGHRILAINRGEHENFLKVKITFPDARAIGILYTSIASLKSLCSDLIREICEDAWSRLIAPSLERELRSSLTERASTQAIALFALNLRHLLMQPPIKGRIVMGVDPAYRTGCKIAVVDATGKVLDTAVVYPTPPQSKTTEAEAILLKLVKKHSVSVFSIGNGTASKETECFIADLIRNSNLPLSYVVVNEAGASVYSASKLAAEEFPQFDVSLRSAVSIARRLQDPLAELVKIEPKAVGVGQYQHDMPQAQLSDALSSVVESCVNQVGVDVNTASPSLLSYVAGISSTVAKNIVTYREENGVFTSREELKKVPKLGPKAFEQCAGFLRIPESDNPLDRTGVHPESYKTAKQLLLICGTDSPSVILKQRGELALAEECNCGVPTLLDIVKDLEKPGRDPRDELPAPILRQDVLDISDLKPGMQLSGTVRNVIDFGAFVDIGVHQDGLVHISQMSEKFIRHPSEVVKVGDQVTVWVIEVDVPKKRIGLTMKQK